MAFNNPVVGGNVLVREAIQSPNFVTEVSGWSINQDGSAEFSNIRIRGGIGTADPVVVGPSGMPQVIIRTTPGNGLIVFPTNRPIELDAATLNSAVIDQGAANERAELQMTGPTVTGATDGVRVVLGSQAQDGSVTAQFAVQDRSGSTTFLAIDKTEVRVLNRRIDSEQLGPGAVVLSGYLNGEARDRFQLLTNGQLLIGDGTNPFDVALYREAAGVLTAEAIFRIYRATSGTNALSLRVVGDTQSRLFVNADGNMNWGPGGATPADVGLSRLSAGQLQVAGSLAATGKLTAPNFASGQAQTPTPGGAPGQTSVAVAFPAAFPATPHVVITPNSTAANLNTSNIRGAVTGITTTGFTINCWRDTNAATNWEWFAHI